jgi:hypothetical protein
MIGGAILEVAGLALVAYDIWISARRQAKLLRRDQLVQLESIVHSREIATPLVVSGGKPPEEPRAPPVEERVAALEERADRTERALEKTPEEISREMTDLIDRRINEVKREVFERFQDARGLLGSELGANLPLRVVGLAFLVVGLTVATAGNVASVVC